MTSLSRLAIRAGTAVALLAGLAGTAMAQNTPSNTTIKNTAQLSYSVNGTPQTPICSKPTGNSTPSANCNDPSLATTFQVDTKANVTVTTTDTAGVPTTPGSAGVMTFTVTNTGNATQDILLSTNNAVGNGSTVFTGANTATDSFDPTSCTITDAGGATITKLAGLAAGASQTVKVSCTIPTTNGANAFTPTDATLVGLKATVAAPGGSSALTEVARVGATPGVVLADGAGPDDANRDATASARSALKVAPAALLVQKTSATLCDTSNGSTTPKAIPGAAIRYTVDVSNGTAAGTASAVVTTLADAMDPNVSFDVDYITAPALGTGCAPVATGGTATSVAGSGIEVTFTPAGGNTRASFGAPKYIVTSSVVSGVVGTNQALSIPTATWNTLLPAEGAYAAGELKPGDKVTVKYNVFIR